MSEVDGVGVEGIEAGGGGTGSEGGEMLDIGVVTSLPLLQSEP